MASAIPFSITTFFARVYPGEEVYACSAENGQGTRYCVPGKLAYVLFGARHIHVYTEASGADAAIDLCSSYSRAYITSCTILPDSTESPPKRERLLDRLFSRR